MATSSDFDFQWLAEKLKKDGEKKLVTLAGAGLSTSAGIPDFRGPSGLYSLMAQEGNQLPQNLVPPGLPMEAVFSIDLFRIQPEGFYRLTAALRPSILQAKPTPCHFMLKILADSMLLRRHFTQNVDGLEEQAGIPSDLIVEAHGSFRSGQCLSCRHQYDFEWLKDKTNFKASDANINVPHCEICDGIVKPNAVLFGEALPQRFFESAQFDIREAKSVLILGSSMVVQPFASLPSFLSSDVTRVFVSLDEPQISDWNQRKEGRDLFFKGTCDDFATQFAKALNKDAELAQLLSS